jgi:hypothetical protein
LRSQQQGGQYLTPDRPFLIRLRSGIGFPPSRRTAKVHQGPVGKRIPQPLFSSRQLPLAHERMIHRLAQQRYNRTFG